MSKELFEGDCTERTISYEWRKCCLVCYIIMLVVRKALLVIRIYITSFASQLFIQFKLIKTLVLLSKKLRIIKTKTIETQLKQYYYPKDVLPERPGRASFGNVHLPEDSKKHWQWEHYPAALLIGLICFFQPSCYTYSFSLLIAISENRSMRKDKGIQILQSSTTRHEKISVVKVLAS